MLFQSVKIKGDLVLMNPAGLEQVRGASGYKYVELDMSATGCMDSAGMDLVFKLATDVRKKGGRLTIRNARPHVREVMDMCRMDAVADIE